jgi:hypothetical protein
VAAATHEQASTQLRRRAADRDSHTLEDEMSDVGGVGSSSRQQSRDDELDAMRKDESTSAIVNKARRDAGFKEADVTVRGDDRTLQELLHDHHGEIGVGEAVGGAIHGAHIVEALGVGHHTLEAAPKLAFHAAWALPVAAWAAGQYGMYETEKWKMEMKDGATRDQLHAAILSLQTRDARYDAAHITYRM